MRKILSFACLLISATAFGQSSTVSYNEDSAFIHKIANNILSSRAVYNNLKYLTKKIGGRLAGSPQMVLAEKWGYKALQEAGADSVRLQECMVPHWVRGGKDKAFVSYKNDKGISETIPVNVAALGNSVGGGPKGVKARLVRVNDFNELESKKNDLQGKIVFYNVPFDDTLLSTFQAYVKNVVYRGAGASRAAKYGAVGVMVRSMTNAMDNVPHTGSLRYSDSLHKIPAVAVGVRDVEKMDTLIDEGKVLTAEMKRYWYMHPTSGA